MPGVVILTTHDLALAQADQLLLLADGHIIAEEHRRQCWKTQMPAAARHAHGRRAGEAVSTGTSATGGATPPTPALVELAAAPPTHA